MFRAVHIAHDFPFVHEVVADEQSELLNLPARRLLLAPHPDLNLVFTDDELADIQLRLQAYFQTRPTLPNRIHRLHMQQLQLYQIPVVQQLKIQAVLLVLLTQHELRLKENTSSRRLPLIGQQQVAIQEPPINAVIKCLNAELTGVGHLNKNRHVGAQTAIGARVLTHHSEAVDRVGLVLQTFRQDEVAVSAQLHRQLPKAVQMELEAPILVQICVAGTELDQLGLDGHVLADSEVDGLGFDGVVQRGVEVDLGRVVVLVQNAQHNSDR